MNSKAIFMGGKINTFHQTLNLIEGNKVHSLKIGDHYIKYDTFDKDLVEDLLPNPESQGIRIYYGYDIKANQKSLVLTTVNKDGLDIEQNGLILGANPCPKSCPDNNLN